MRLSSWSLAFLSLWTVYTQATNSSDVVNLDTSNFDSIVSSEALILVQTFSSCDQCETRCESCEALGAQFEEAATALKEKNIPLARLNCRGQSKLCPRQGLHDHSTLNIFRYGTFAHYNGSINADGIINYMIKQSLPAVTSVTSANHDEFQHAGKVVAIAYVSEASDVPAPSFSAAAEQHRDDYLFGLTTDPKAMEDAGVTPPAIVLYRKFDDPKIDYQPASVTSASVEEIETFLKDNSIPLVDQFSRSNRQTYVASGLDLAYLFLDPTDSSREEHLAYLRPLAKAHKGKMNFVWVDAVEFPLAAKTLNLREPKWPAFVILHDFSQQFKYPMDQNVDVTESTVTAWVEQYLAGNLKPDMRSQVVVIEESRNVVTVESSQFDEVVFNDDKDIFLIVNGRWVGNHNRLRTWDYLADHYAGVKDRITIAKMHATEFPPPAPFRVFGLSTIKFKPAGTREFVDYDGDRSLQSLIGFVEQHATNPLDPNTPFEPKSASAKVVVTEVEAQHPLHPLGGVLSPSII